MLFESVMPCRSDGAALPPRLELSDEGAMGPGAVTDVSRGEAAEREEAGSRSSGNGDGARDGRDRERAAAEGGAGRGLAAEVAALEGGVGGGESTRGAGTARGEPASGATSTGATGRLAGRAGAESRVGMPELSCVLAGPSFSAGR